jgi:hypothetical protein
MPRRTGRRNKAKASETLDLSVELSLAWWTPPPIGDPFPDINAMRDAWNEHGPRILPHYVAQLPGQRPPAMYFTDAIPLPPPIHARRPGDEVQRWGGREFLPAWCYWGCTTGTDDHYQGGISYGELLHLISLGIVDGAEKRRALASGIDDRHYDPDARYRRYEPLCHNAAPAVADDDA